MLFPRSKSSSEVPKPGVEGASPRSRKVDVQMRPAVVADVDADLPVTLKVDSAYRVGSLVVVVGWCTRPLTLSVRADDRDIAARCVAVERADVLSHFSLPAGALPGFVLIAKCLSDDLSLTWQHGGSHGESLPLRLDDYETNPPAGNVLAPAWAMLALAETPHTSAWTGLIKRIPDARDATTQAKGFLEAVLCPPGGGFVVVGWVVHDSDCYAWLEDEDGETYPLQDAFRRYRHDVYEAVKDHLGPWAGDAGFVIHVPGTKANGRVVLKVLTERGIHVLAERAQTGTLPADVPAAARMLLFLGVSLEDLHQRIPTVDEPLLSAIIERSQRHWSALPVKRFELGKAPESVEVSIIVPLYGRTDFVEHQLIEFCRDPWLQKHAEVIYVLDDPSLVDGFRQQAIRLQRLYKVPFVWVWGGVNRGFSGANNLGAQQARGNKLLFLNSDAFPQGPGWLEALTRVLDERKDIGAVAPRLLFADGSIQHAGMEFRRVEDLGIWVNHHPSMGLDPLLDSRTSLVTVPAITGACMAIRQKDFERVGGWDIGYLIGDFEDSDLCFKLRQLGLSIGYLPTVQLTHLERQSFKLLGQDEFRTRVMIYNAVRHQMRWKDRLETAGSERS